jgi:hypothetical protein
MAAERMKIIFHHLHGKDALFAPVSFKETGNEKRMHKPVTAKY